MEITFTQEELDKYVREKIADAMKDKPIDTTSTNNNKSAYLRVVRTFCKSPTDSPIYRIGVFSEEELKKYSEDDKKYIREQEL